MNGASEMHNIPDSLNPPKYYLGLGKKVVRIFKLLYEYQTACLKRTDIHQHLPILYRYARRCKHITEMGVRGGSSTRAFLFSNPKKYFAYDLNLDPVINGLFEYARMLGKDYHYIQSDVLKIEIEETDFLFIYTYHCYEQLVQELALHAKNVRKYIAFHDTVSYGRVGENLASQSFSGSKGILFAIEEYLAAHKDWRVVHDAKYNNGLIVIQKTSYP
jgi:hypothetical protein